EDDRTVMEEALKQAWGTIPVSFFEELIESMERRVAACSSVYYYSKRVTHEILIIAKEDPN
ncbi:hypothetical protein IFR05_017634, partial [Cadophora sp. M221]